LEKLAWFTGQLFYLYQLICNHLQLFNFIFEVLTHKFNMAFVIFLVTCPNFAKPFKYYLIQD